MNTYVEYFSTSYDRDFRDLVDDINEYAMKHEVEIVSVSALPGACAVVVFKKREVLRNE